MNLRFRHYFWVLQLSLLILSADVVSSRHGRDLTDPCDHDVRLKGHYISSDQITVLMNGFSESRIPLLLSIASSSYAFSPNGILHHHSLGQPSYSLYSPLPAFEESLLSIYIIRQQSSSLNARFLPRPNLIRTRAVLVCDDDMDVDNESLEVAFRIWTSNQDRLVGFLVRSHELDLSTKEWIYTVYPDKYSIILTKLMILKTEYLFNYNCGGPALMEMQRN